jgi:hypothetical protein
MLLVAADHLGAIFMGEDWDHRSTDLLAVLPVTTSHQRTKT